MDRVRQWVACCVSAPHGQSIPARVYGQGDGTFRVEYTPTEVGKSTNNLTTTTLYHKNTNYTVYNYFIILFNIIYLFIFIFDWCGGSVVVPPCSNNFKKMFSF